MRKYILLVLLLSVFFFNSIAFGDGISFGQDKISEDLKTNVGEGVTFIDIIENIVAYLIGFLYLISIILGLYAGFTILTSGGEEEKVKKGKNILIYVIIGLIVIFLSSVLINFIIDKFTDSTIVGT